MPSNYQLNIAYFDQIPVSNVKNLVPIFFDKEKYALHYVNLQLSETLSFFALFMMIRKKGKINFTITRFKKEPSKVDHQIFYLIK